MLTDRRASFDTVHATAQEEAYQHIKRGIRTGELRPGMRLAPDDIAAEIGTSRMPVREALNRLATEGLIVNRPNRGSVVRVLTEKEVREVFAGEGKRLPARVQHMVDAFAAQVHAVAIEQHDLPVHARKGRERAGLVDGGHADAPAESLHARPGRPAGDLARAAAPVLPGAGGDLVQVETLHGRGVLQAAHLTMGRFS